MWNLSDSWRGREWVLGLADHQHHLVLATFQGVHRLLVGAVVQDEVATYEKNENMFYI